MIEPNLNLPWPIAVTGVLLIAEREQFRARAYKPIPTDPWTVGWGATGPEIGPNTVWTLEFADQDLCNRLTVLTGQVREACTLEPNENELAALVSLAYNIGIGGLRKSTVVRQHNAGNHEAAARAFSLWNKAGGQVLRGLVARRLAEAALYLTPPTGAEPHAMPQAVQPESKPIAGPIAASGTTVAGAGGVLALLGPLGDQVTVVKGFVGNVKGFVVDTLGVPTDWLLPIVLIGAGAVVVAYRLKQRREGFA